MAARPILKPGLPGDLLLILDTARNTLIASGPESTAKHRTIALTTIESLEMWLGIKPVAEMPEPD